MLNLAGYEERELLYTGSRTFVYRGICTRDRNPVIIKVLRNPNPSFKELVQFRNQYVIARDLAHPGIVQPLALERYGNSYALVMPDSGAIALSEYWHSLQPSYQEFLSLTSQIVEALHYLSKQRIIHKDIKPTNIIIHPETHQIQLIDFSISSLLPKEQQQLLSPNVLEGSLSYISPEQTGRMNRGIDYRTDFYSLGVTLYELLCGELPFQSEDPMELVHCHIAQMAQFPPEYNIPLVLQEIILKLMRKNAEERYQSALGLKHDLEQCLQQLETSAELFSFKLGEQDRCDRFIIPEKLYGRDAQVETLLQAFDRVARGQTEMMLVAGFSGIGKTAVVNEVHKPIVKKRGYFIKGKYDQFNRNIPFSAFVQAFRELMGQLLGESDSDLEQWKAKILAALGENAQVVIEVVPELERIIGPQPSALQLEGNAAQNRFNFVFANFLRIFTTKEHPLVMFLDDLQWADSASLNLLKLLMEDSKAGYLLILGAYRDNEVFPGHPLILQLEQIEQENGIISTITLEPLPSHCINHLIAETLNEPLEEVQPLTDLVYQTAQGNPFFTTQFIKGLYNENLIKFEDLLGRWTWNISEIYNNASSDDVVIFMARRLQKFPEETQEILQLAACIGNRFDLENLAVVSQSTKEEVADRLWVALQEGLVLPINESYKLFQKTTTEDNFTSSVLVGYRFLHDRVQQAAYSLIAEEKRQEVHLTIGRQLLQNLNEEEKEEQLFNIVNHLNEARELIISGKERENIARLNLQASQKAKLSVAYEASRNYCYEGQRFLTEETWQTNYELMFSLAITTIETEHLNHDLDEARKVCEQTIPRVQREIDRAKINAFEILFEVNDNKMYEALDITRQALIPLGITLPSDPDRIQAETERLRKEVELPIEEIANLEDLPILENEEKLTAIEILTNAVSAAYISQPNLYPLLILHGIRYFINYGQAPVATAFYTWHGSVLCGVYDEIEAGYAFGKLCLRVLDKLNAREFETKARNMLNVFIRPWKEPLRNAVHDLIRAIASGFETGDLEFAFYAATHRSNYFYFSGGLLEDIRKLHEQYFPAIVKAKYEFQKSFFLMYQQLIANLMGENEVPQVLEGNIFDRPSYLQEWEESNVHLAFCFYEAQTRLFYWFEDYARALEVGEQGRQTRGAALSMPYVSEQIFYYSLVLLAQNEIAPEHWEILKNDRSRLEMWSGFAPMNFQHKCDLIDAEKYRVLGNKFEATEYYDRAIAGAKEHEFLHEEALANELAAKAYLSWGKAKVAAGYMQEAYYLYAQWGAKAKTDDLENRYPQLLAPLMNRSSQFSEQETLTSTATESGNILDLTSVFKASQVLSEEISLSSLLSKVMHILIENAGATQGTLILDNSGTWEITARYAKGDCNLSILPLEEADALPHSIINWVKRTEEVVAIDNLSEDHPFKTDTYLLPKPTQSLVCTPILNQGQSIGILYLENHLTPEAFTTDRMKVLDLLTTQAAISINNARFYQTLEDKVAKRTSQLAERTAQLATANTEITELNERLKAENLRLGAELDIARQVQEMILPKPEELRAIPSLDIAGYMTPADEVGGDYYDVLVEDEVVTIGIGDVTGHGLESGLVMMMAQTVIRAMKELREEDPVRFLNTVNRTLYKNVERMQVDRQLTLAILNYNQGHLSISGQHEEVLVVRADGSLETVDTMDLGMTIALVDDIAEFIAQVTVKLEPGDGVVLYTDGIPEAENKAGELYGLERLCETIQQHWSGSAEEIQAEAIADVQEFIGSHKVFDDITLVVIKEQGCDRNHCN
ncbi:AAA family ATPase [Roseofilum casamattae]|uniref:AAA family ATPase n=1 Tax=Roseofilum casamattae BLCC-M143 TaxID=3022442 RepID=A0ABT7BZQ9_9CYAN|nr:AAA family ATPase [Roseofilum casamattae]MDJ1184677.1 AAA family ATPase [Roseofilum casamattae BLCC-M143]